ncbi:MAG: primosomal protein N' [Planctomycetia bacterium]|nr:primosomal protein N' [Planctomycetia bacterium]
MSTQRTLFDAEPAAWELDDQAQAVVATIVFPDLPDKEYHYAVPSELADRVRAGVRVRVPLGRGDRATTGYCVDVRTRQIGQRRLKDVRSVVDDEPLLSPAMLRLTRWMAEHYLCPLGQVLETVLPAGVRQKAGIRTELILSVPQPVLAQLSALKLPKKQAAVLDELARRQPLTLGVLAQSVGCTMAPIAALRKKGLIVAQTRRVRSLPREAPAPPTEAHLEMNPDQSQALDAILELLRAQKHGTVLLHGVTGSGKTEVYIQAIEEVRRYGRQAIVLVPEISLTPQTKQRFKARFGNVAVLHSHLSDSERSAQWDQIARGEVSVVIGARSAVFAPTPHLGLIVMDEEHESTFKQQTAPRYHARDVALYRAQAEDVPLVLGSATPSLESWQQAIDEHYRMISLPKRVFDRPLPLVGTIDLRNEPSVRRWKGAISRPLATAMEKTLADGGQVILLLNRRGYSTHIQCPSCGHVVRCPSCDLALTHHRAGDVALCHYCDYQIPSPPACPECQFAGIRYSGLGTQRLEAEVQSRFPQYACLRMDTDSMQKPGSHEKALAEFRDGKVRILLGTQMIAKGLDFPEVTLVGVVNADTILHLPDFRAAERTCQLIVQVAGRTGRGPRGGRVLVQSFAPDHPAIRAAAEHNYEGFARQELPARKALGYPPFTRMVRIVVRGRQVVHVQAFARQIRERLREEAAKLPEAALRVLGPAPCPFPKLRGDYRFHLQAQGPDGEVVRGVVERATAELPKADEVQWIVDVDPLDML